MRMNEVYFHQLTAHCDLAGLMRLLNQLCGRFLVVAQKSFSSQSEHFPLLSSEYFVKLFNIYKVM